MVLGQNGRLTCLLLGLFSFSCAGAFAQLATTTALVGTVADSEGAVVAGVKMTAVNEATQDTYSVITGGDGSYSIQFVKVGVYTITAERSGFTTLKKTNVVVQIDQTVRTDFTLQVGQVSQTMTVTAETPPIATDEASLREIVGQNSISNLPLNGRDPLQLAVSTPQVLPGQKGTNGVPPGEDFIAAGTREIQNSISLDGISLVNNLITTATYHPSVDAISELEVQTGTYSAQYGAYLGAHLNLVSKSGTNDVHGALFEFVRNSDFAAKNFFASATAPIPPLHQNQFGFEFDAPLYIPKLYDGRNKTFVMVDYEGLRIVSQSTSLATPLTSLMRQGNFSELSTPIKNPSNGGAPFPGNVIPSSQLSPQAQNILKYMPLPNLTGISNNLRVNYPTNNNFNSTIDRIDQNIGNKLRLFFRYALENETFLTGATAEVNETYIPADTRNWVAAVTYTLGPTMVNDLRVGYQNVKPNALNYFAVNKLADAGSQLGIPGFTGDVDYNNPGIPVFSINGYLGLGNGSTNWYQTDTTWQGADSFTYIHGAHTIIAGAELRKLITGRAAVNSADGAFSFTGAFTGNGAADFVLGIPANDTTPGPEINNIVAQWRDGFFIVDNWRATSRLTLNLGFRYELPTVPYTVNGYATKLNRDQTALVPSNAPQPGFQFIDPNHKDFAPRFGLAYRVAGNTVVRAGFGIYYNPNQNNTWTFLSTNPPFSAVTTYNSLPTTPTLSLSNPTPAGYLGKPGLSNVVSPNWHLPTSVANQWSFDLEQGLWHNAALEIQYLGSHDNHLDTSNYVNTPLPGPGSIAARRPNPNFNSIRIIDNIEISNYEGVSTILRQRLSHGLTLLASYTWSHTLDVGTDSNGGGTAMNPYDWADDYGNSNWDIRNRLVAQWTYDLPFLMGARSAFVRKVVAGWAINGIWIWQSGSPFNVVIGTDLANTGTGSQRPNLVGTPSSNCGDGHLTGCIAASAFALPALYTYGSAGRNLLFGPGLANVDFSAFKSFRLLERLALQFRAEFFNSLNHPNFSNPSATFGTSTFGSISSTTTSNRVIQFGLKLVF